MADKPHPADCEKAEVGSICDCFCAGKRHAVRGTRGGVPGAGAVTRRAQKIAAADGRAAVVNNNAVKATAAGKAPDVPKTPAKPKTPLPGDSARDRKAVADQMDAYGAKRQAAADEFRRIDADNDAWQRRRIAELKAQHPGKTLAEIVQIGRKDPETKQRLAAQQAAAREAREWGVDLDAIMNDNRKKADAAARRQASAAARKTSEPAPATTAAVKLPAPLRAIVEVLGKPSGDTADTSAAARYQKLTPDLLRQLTPEQKEQLLADIDRRAALYKPKSPTGTKLAAARRVFTGYNSGDAKAGMRGSETNRPTGGDKVTHLEHGHGKVRAITSGTATVQVDFGDKTIDVRPETLTYGHQGADTNTAAKTAAAGARATARQAKAAADIDALAERVINPRKTDSFTPLAERGDDLSAFNRLSEYDRDTLDALPAATKAKALAAADRMFDKGTRDVRERVNRLREKWGQPTAKVPVGAPSQQARQAMRALDGQSTTLPYSMVLANVGEQELREKFTPGERAQMRALAAKILAGMREDAPDRKGLEKAVARLDTIDPPGTRRGPDADADKVAVKSARRGKATTTTARTDPPARTGPADTGEKVTSVDNRPLAELDDTALRAERADAERRSLQAGLPFAQRDAARQRMHELEKEIFRRENPYRTPGPGADKYQGKTVKPLAVGKSQAGLEQIGAQQDTRGLARGTISQLSRSKLIDTNYIGSKAALTHEGHVKLAAQRGDGTHQKLNEQVADAERRMDQAQAVIDAQMRSLPASGQARSDMLRDRLFDARRKANEEAYQQAYSEFYALKRQRDEWSRRTP